MNLEAFIQTGIVILSCISAWLISSKGSWNKWGFVVGLASEPFWFYTTYTHEQWGLFAICFFFTWTHARGARRGFTKRTWGPPVPCRLLYCLRRTRKRDIRRSWRMATYTWRLTYLRK